MRCKNHYTDLSSIVGVCACCLRERLLSVIAAEDQAQVQIHVQNPASYIHNRTRNQSDRAAVSSDNDVPRHHRHRHTLSDQLFYTTPQVPAPTSKKRSIIRFLSFQYIFRSRNRKSVDSNLREHCGGDNINPTSTPSWVSSVVHGRRRRRKHPVSVDDDESTVTVAVGQKGRQHWRDRGLSPVRNSDVGEDEANTPWRTPARRGGGGGGGHQRNLSGLNLCLSPLLRASPNRQWNQAPDGVLSGEIRAPVKAHLSNTKAYCANRSRKIADFGRPNQNR